VKGFDLIEDLIVLLPDKEIRAEDIRGVVH
jgi:hypothetical protein